MPITQRWVHCGLILAAVVLSMCLTVLILGASRGMQNDAGLPGARGAGFYLKDASGKIVSFEPRSEDNPIHLLILAEQDSAELAEHTDVVNRLISTYRDDTEVRLVGIAYLRDPSLLGPSASNASILERKCSQLQVIHDQDGSVARAYRVSNSPTLIVIDRTGIIRGRIGVSSDGASVVVTEIINALRSSGVPMRSLMGDDARN